MNEIPIPSKFEAALLKLREIKEPVSFQIDAFTTWHLLNAIKIARTHPGFQGTMPEHVEHLAKQVGKVVSEKHPDLKFIFDMGWSWVNREGKE